MRPIKIIAEIGINHNGSLETAKKLIYEAKQAGADLAKFQLRDHSSRIDLDTHPWKDILLKCTLSRRMVQELKLYCDMNDIEFFASPFDLDAVRLLEEIGVKRYKIASNQVYNEPLVRAIYNTAKPVMVSYGAVRDDFVKPPLIMKMFEKDGVEYPDIKKLYCISKYPAPIEDIDFFIHYSFGYRSIFEYYDGFSDHTIGIAAAMVAMSLGAKIIEKHFTLDRDMPGPDHSCSATPSDLKALCSFRDEVERILYK